MAADKLPAPPLDPELQVIVTKMNLPSMAPTLDAIRASRGMPSFGPSLEDILAARPFMTHTEHTLPNHGPTISIFQRRRPSTPPTPATTPLRPCMYYIHGGGMIRGTRFTLLDTALAALETLDVIVASVEYRLAPENPYPAGLDDCSAGLAWVFVHAEELGIDDAKIMVAGHSGGACLAAGAVLRLRDAKRGELAAAGKVDVLVVKGDVCGLFLGCPMLDDRNVTVSSRQLTAVGWSRAANLMAWEGVLGGEEHVGKEDVSPYAAPARAENLSGMPSTYVDVGSADVLRDEAVAFASKLWAGGVQAELHVWPGGFHGFEVLAYAAALSGEARETQMRWFKRAFGL